VLSFSKYQGLGNDFLMLDGRDAPSTDFCFELCPELVKLLCDRRFGVGGDGVILALPPNAGGELRMRIFNADGTEPEMCGNGIRCLARFLADSDGDEPGRQWQIDTLAGRIVPELLSDGTIRVDMGAPFLQPAAIPTTLEIGPSGIPEGLIEAAGESFQVGAAGMGNPHMVIPVADLEQVDLERFGAALELHPSFPAKANVHFVQALSPSHLVMRVWERGAGPTLACGTGACATLVVCHRLGIAGRRARLDLPGGPLEIHWDEASDHLFMDGPAEAVFDGVLSPLLWNPAPAADFSDQMLDKRASEQLDFEQQDPEQLEQQDPEQLEQEQHELEQQLVEQQSQGQEPGPGVSQGEPAINCSVACVQGCQRPHDCPTAAIRAKTLEMLNSSSLDDLVALASNSIESRSRARAQRLSALDASGLDTPGLDALALDSPGPETAA
jgi:diaminopimelate epimerase